jgi:hypothetical protein
MKFLNLRKFIIAVMAIFGFLVSGHSVAQTAADTDIDNFATLKFTVGASPELVLESGPENADPSLSGNTVLGGGNGTNTKFEVDRLIDLTVARISSPSPDAAAGQPDIVLGFTVTNESNATLDFDLETAVNLTGIVATDTGVTPAVGASVIDFTVSIAGSDSVFADNDDSGIYESAIDTDTYIDDLAAGDSRNVYVVIDLPTGGTQDLDDYLFVTLIAIASDPSTSSAQGSIITTDDNGYGADGTVTLGNVSLDDPDSVDDVFADGESDAYYDAGDEITDPIRNGQFSASRILEINAGMNVEKTAIAVWDNINLDSSPKAIPGAYVEYTLTIENLASLGGQSATLASIADSIPDNVELDLGLLEGSGCTPSSSTDEDGVTVYDDPDTACFSQDSSAYATTSIVKVIYTDVSAGTTHEGYFNTGGAQITFADPILTVNLDDILTSSSTFTPPATANFATATNDGEIEAEDSVDIIFNVVID